MSGWHMVKPYVPRQWAISSEAPKRGTFNDQGVGPYTASDWRWKWWGSGTPDHDMVCSLWKHKDREVDGYSEPVIT